MLDPDMGTWTYEYDLVGNLIKQTDAKGQVLEFTYDALNRLTAKRYPLSANPAVEYFYDDATKDNCIGRLSKITDQSGSTEFFYDNLGREIKSVKTVGSSQYVVVREYDSLDRLTTLTYPDAEVVNYAYDANSGLLEKVYSSTTEYIKDLAYNAKGQIREIDCGNNTKTTYTYGQDLRLSRILTTNDQRLTTLQDLNYIFDKNGNLTTLTDSLKNNIRTYAYDDLDRLTEALNLPAPGGGYTDFYYQYDSIGNMTYKSDIGQMAYGQNAGPHALTSAGGYNYQYDANGNMTVGKNKTLIYDAENRLLEVNESGVIASFLYDGDGGRVMKGLSPTGTVPEQWTLYIGSLFEKDSDGTTRKHIFAGANRVATKGLSTEGGLSLNYFHSDHLGSSNVITDSSGAQVEYCEYTPYGSFSRHTTQDPGRTRHYFTGKELDNTGLYFYGARYYDPGLGRFITADTIVQAPYDPQSLNRYSYCRNNPLKYVDPTGHFWWFIPLIIGAIIGAVSAGVQSDWNIKAMLVGAAIGGVSGVVGFGAAGVTSQILGRVGSAMFGGMVGGATAGLLNSAYYGGDILRGTLMGAGIGALGGLAFGVLSQIDVTGLVSGFTKVSLYAAAGGGLSKLGGGEFWQGAALAGAVAMSEIVYKGVLSTDKNGRKNSNPSMKTATGDAKPKLNEDETIVIHNDGSTEVGTGFGPRAKSGLFGLGRLIQEDAAWTQWIAKNVPGINGTALFHDILTHFYSSTPIGFTNGLIFNVPSMPPAFAITALGSAAAAEFSPILGQFVVYGNDDK
jgi:RHS repeat-associated protein